MTFYSKQPSTTYHTAINPTNQARYNHSIRDDGQWYGSYAPTASRATTSKVRPEASEKTSWWKTMVTGGERQGQPKDDSLNSKRKLHQAEAQRYPSKRHKDAPPTLSSQQSSSHKGRWPSEEVPLRLGRCVKPNLNTYKNLPQAPPHSYRDKPLPPTPIATKVSRGAKNKPPPPLRIHTKAKDTPKGKAPPKRPPRPEDTYRTGIAAAGAQYPTQWASAPVAAPAKEPEAFLPTQWWKVFTDKQTEKHHAALKAKISQPKPLASPYNGDVVNIAKECGGIGGPAAARSSAGSKKSEASYSALNSRGESSRDRDATSRSPNASTKKVKDTFACLDSLRPPPLNIKPKAKLQTHAQLQHHQAPLSAKQKGKQSAVDSSSSAPRPSYETSSSSHHPHIASPSTWRDKLEGIKHTAIQRYHAEQASRHRDSDMSFACQGIDANKVVGVPYELREYGAAPYVQDVPKAGGSESGSRRQGDGHGNGDVYRGCDDVMVRYRGIGAGRGRKGDVGTFSQELNKYF